MLPLQPHKGSVTEVLIFFHISDIAMKNLQHFNKGPTKEPASAFRKKIARKKVIRINKQFLVHILRGGHRMTSLALQWFERKAAAF